MNEYAIKVIVEYSYIVEANSAEEAEEEGWNHEEHRMSSVVDTIEVEEVR